MNPALAAGAAAVVALMAFAFSGKKKKLPTGEAEIGPIDVSPPDEVQVPAEVLAPVPVSRAAPPIDIPVSMPVEIPAITAKSPGWPEIPNAGATSGATSVSKKGEVDSAFDELVAKAIASGDVAALRDLAMQATLRGLADTAETIRAEVARLTKQAPEETPALPTIPIAAPTDTHLGRATISMKAGSRGPDVVAWQSVIGTKQDGIFGPNTDRATRSWQSKHGLVSDGIVGPKTWGKAYSLHPELATQPRVTTAPEPAPITTVAPPVPIVIDEIEAPAPTPIVSPTFPKIPKTIKKGSRGTVVKEWQRVIKVKADGIFGPNTHAATMAWQAARPPLKVDGIVGPNTWKASFTGIPAPVKTPVPAAPEPTAPAPIMVAAPTPVAAPVAAAPPESDARRAAGELVLYLIKIGGLAGRRTENKETVKGFQRRLGLVADGLYGRNSAKAVILQGFIPVVPFYWPRTNTSAAKREFTAFVQTYLASDPTRAKLWNQLLADVQRA